MTRQIPSLRAFLALLTVALYAACGETRTGSGSASLNSGSPVITPTAAAASTPTYRPATESERNGVDQTILSIGSMLDRARADLVNEYTSEAHQVMVADAERELQVDSIWLGPAPSASDRDPQYQEAHRLLTDVMNTMRRLLTIRPGDPVTTPQELIQKAEEQLGQAREATRLMARG